MEYPRLSSQRRALLAQATDRYAEALVGSPAAEYLEGRGISLEVAQRFQLGYVEEPLEGQERFRGRLAIPYLTPTGTVGMRFRRFDGKEPKFDSEEGQATHLYNVPDLHRSDPWISVCEGEPDTWVMSGILDVPAVGLPGVEHWAKKSGIWSKLLQDYDTVFILMDPDEAGRKFIKEIAHRVENPVVIDLPMDLNDTVNEYGPDWVLEKMGLN